MSLPKEITREQWDKRSRRHRRKKLKCECNGESFVAQRVFRCRAPKGSRGFACGRYCCACVGGADDNRCSSCWEKRQARLRARGLEAA